MPDVVEPKLRTTDVERNVAPSFSKGDPVAARRLLREWREQGDENEQRETLEFLRQALNASRPRGCGVVPEP